jgi:hypothetical protein
VAVGVATGAGDVWIGIEAIGGSGRRLPGWIPAIAVNAGAFGRKRGPCRDDGAGRPA